MERSILLGLGLALFAITLIGVGGMTTSVLVAERVQGSGSAINVAGSLRRLTHRMSALVLSDAENRVHDHRQLRDAIAHFEKTLDHPALRRVLARKPESDFARTYATVNATWSTRLKPLLVAETLPGVDLHPPEAHNALLLAVEAFVADLNTFVAQLEADTEEAIFTLRSVLGVALVLTIALVLGGMIILRRGVLEPLADLVHSAVRIARGDFSARARHEGQDELGRVGQSFNLMATELSKLYSDLEQRVADKTAELARSNQSLELLYHSIARLHHAPTAPETYQAMISDMERVLGIQGGMACLLPRLGGPATILSNTLGPCQARELGNCPHCAEVLDGNTPWAYMTQPDRTLLVMALRDTERQYGVLSMALPAGRRLEDWQEQLLQALCRHISIALGITYRTEQERLLALQEERSVIARELHDSIAQALAYMKIQSSLLQPMLTDPGRRPEAERTLADLREGINAAYRQLRELLATFRLRMQGDFLELLRHTVEEFSSRSGLPIHLEDRLAGCQLSPNQEIHTLQIIREALSNALRHAQATDVWVRIDYVDDMVTVRVEDNGVGLVQPQVRGGLHYGLGIMRERAAGLQGEIDITPRPQGGTQVKLRFRVETPMSPPVLPQLADAA